ncbi:hypothetical protein Q7C36_005326 [Tachysurus vachellii]|uniref:Uncharacterized protein n=1 Tax=Tachysurus vachellii TaxID=175792 RepID=A0AA88NJW8_TACVA|nr:hypothetical protein Q7C36_005326 [Tachysurus vachellii]
MRFPGKPESPFVIPPPGCSPLRNSASIKQEHPEAAHCSLDQAEHNLNTAKSSSEGFHLLRVKPCHHESCCVSRSDLPAYSPHRWKRDQSDH